MVCFRWKKGVKNLFFSMTSLEYNIFSLSDEIDCIYALPEILEQQITTSKLEGIHNCAHRTEKFVSN
jgi:hypothetical protein